MDQNMCENEDKDKDTYEDSDTVSFSTLPLLKDTFSLPLPPLISGPPTPAKTVPQLTYLRMYITPLVASLTGISEHAQVNSANQGRQEGWHAETQARQGGPSRTASDGGCVRSNRIVKG